MRVLLVVDDALFRRALARFLAQRHEVAEVDSAEAALVCLDSSELVVTDLHLPGAGGLGLIRQIRADPATSGLPVIVVSAEPEHWVAERALAAGASAYLEKPFCLSRFGELVERLGGEA